MRRVMFLLAVLSIAASVSAQRRITPREYIEKYKHLAIADMEAYGIPASVKMAQALLESDSGNSRLAVQANNHFGIKCKSNWRGETLNHDDDKAGECFRKYDTPEDSFRDHAEFISGSARYERLFALDPLDYKAWAQGLKDCGYATSPQYPERLIRVIETHELYRLDTAESRRQSPAESDWEENVRQNLREKQHDKDEFFSQTTTTQEQITGYELLADTGANGPQNPREQTHMLMDVDNYAVSTRTVGSRPVYHTNGSEFVLAERGDTYENLAAMLGIKTKTLRKHNDAPTGQPEDGEYVFVRQKAGRALNGRVMHSVQKGETLRDVAQKYGIRVQALARRNRISTTTELLQGQQIRLM